jgi:hypothetical protein
MTYETHMNKTNSWFIHKLADGTCEITQELEVKEAEKTWGPFEAHGEAIARRVGLIRSGHCQPKLTPE